MPEFTHKPSRLSDIPTAYSALSEAHGDDPTTRRRAQAWLIDLYGPVIRKYLLGAVTDPDRADELYQQFFTRLVEGKFRGFDRDRGRFRLYVKRVLRNLLHTPPGRPAVPLGSDCGDLAAPAEGAGGVPGDDAALWRQEILEKAWQQLAREEPLLYTVLRHFADHADQTSAQAAAALAPHVGERTAVWVRKRKMEARERFAGCLIAEVARLVAPPTRDEVIGELIDLDLYGYCKRFVDRLLPPDGAPAR
jgi:RNA polymerase sigma-70 factor (ECF subfamily)